MKLKKLVKKNKKWLIVSGIIILIVIGLIVIPKLGKQEITKGVNKGSGEQVKIVPLTQEQVNILGQNVLSSETFEYTTLTPTQTKKRCLNDEGREYKKAIINYDIKGNKLSENYEYIVSWMYQETTWQYDENEKLLKRTFKNNERSEERRVGKECRSRWSPYH